MAEPKDFAAQGSMPVLIAGRGSHAAAAAEALRAAGVPAEWRASGTSCIVTVPAEYSDRAGEILAQTPGLRDPLWTERLLHAAAWAVLILLAVTALLVFAR